MKIIDNLIKNDKIIDTTINVSLVLLTIIFPIALYYALIASPEDYQQGHTVRIMYVHVPSAYFSTIIYGFCAICAGFYLYYKNSYIYMLMTSSFVTGGLLTFVCLVTGGVWGKPMWGTWWVWDARLTSMLFLLFIYISLMIFSNVIENVKSGKKFISIFVLIGFINIPIIKFSVQWWNTIHQPSSLIRNEGIAIHNDMLLPLFLMMVVVLLFSIIFTGKIYKNKIVNKKINFIKGQ